MLESRLDKLDCTLSSCHYSPRQLVDNRRHENGRAFSRARGDYHPPQTHSLLHTTFLPIITALAIVRLSVRVHLALCTPNIRQKTTS